MSFKKVIISSCFSIFKAGPFGYKTSFPEIPHDVDDDNIAQYVLERNIVQIAASFDMGWTTRGNGKSYDSLSGTAALIGFFSKQVISFITYNRKCKSCDNGVPKENHPCVLNFEGSAKSMEPKAAVELVSNNKIFDELNLQLGIFIGDNDSTAIHDARNSVFYEIVKQADTNHTGKGLSNALYKIKPSYKELTTAIIKYLKRAFAFAVSQNAPNSKKIAQAFKNIPYHCFNQHKM